MLRGWKKYDFPVSLIDKLLVYLRKGKEMDKTTRLHQIVGLVSLAVGLSITLCACPEHANFRTEC